MLVPKDLLEQFRSAGWWPGRSVGLSSAVTTQIPEQHPAFPILSGFSDITVGKCGPGELCATSDVTFRFIERCDDASIWSNLLQTVLVGVASVHNDHGQLYVDSIGRFFNISAIHDAAGYQGDSFAAAMHALLLGIPCRPMLRPDQESVTLYGREFRANHPEVYNYSAVV